LKDVAAQLRGFGPVGLLALFVILAGNLVVVPLSAVLVLVWAQLSQTPLQTLGFTAPPRWTRTLAIGIPFGVALKLVMKAIVMPLFGAPAINARYHYLAGNAAALPWMLYAVVRRRLWRGDRVSRILLRASRQAPRHAPSGALAGLVFGTVFAVTGQIWLPMVAHAAFDVTAVALIYWGWESAVAHFLFR